MRWSPRWLALAHWAGAVFVAGNGWLIGATCESGEPACANEGAAAWGVVENLAIAGFALATLFSIAMLFRLVRTSLALFTVQAAVAGIAVVAFFVATEGFLMAILVIVLLAEVPGVAAVSIARRASGP